MLLFPTFLFFEPLSNLLFPLNLKHKPSIHCNYTEPKSKSLNSRKHSPFSIKMEMVPSPPKSLEPS
jgi:hypothetical protein